MFSGHVMNLREAAIGPSSQKALRVRVFAVVLVIITFAVDLMLPLGVAVPMAYVGPLLITLWLPRHADTLIAATSCSFLTVIGALDAPAGGEILWIGVVNRALAITIVWITAALVLLHKRAAEHITQLRHWLPVCASCKKIRGDQGYWQGLEEFVEQHSEVLLTHSLCPTCTEKWSPELSPQLTERHPEVYKE